MAAAATIEKLALNHKNLKKMRYKAIKGFFFGAGRKPKALKLEEAKSLVGQMDTLDSSGRLRPFCFALKQLLPKYINGGAQP